MSQNPCNKVLVITPIDLVACAIQTTLRAERLDVEADQTLSRLNHADADLLFLDDRTRSLRCMAQTLSFLQQRFPRMKVVVMTTQCTGFRIKNALNHGAVGYVALSDPLVVQLKWIEHSVNQGHIYLSPSAQSALLELEDKEAKVLHRVNDYHRQVLQHMIEGQDAKSIARALGKKPGSIYQVQRYLKDLFGVADRHELLDAAQRYGIVTVSEI